MKLETFTKPSAVSLIGANLVPVIGVIVFDWSVFYLMVLFWAENVIIGLLNVVKLLGAVKSDKDMPGWVHFLGKLFMAAFFTIHYGGFCAGHGVFVFGIFGSAENIDMGRDSDFIYRMLFREKLIWAIAALFASHLFSMVYNYFIMGERKNATLESIMTQPYARIVVLHITIILGAIPVLALKSPLGGLLLLVVLKTGMDLKAHFKERRKFDEKGS